MPYATVTAYEVRPLVEAIARGRNDFRKMTAEGSVEIPKQEWVDGIVEMLDGMGHEMAYNIIEHMVDANESKTRCKSCGSVLS